MIGSAILLASLALPAQAVDESKPSPLAVLYIGEEGREQRGEAYRELFESWFAHFDHATHESLTEQQLEGAQVVVLDWHQDMSSFPPTSSPLGEREEWSKPTLLIGSAGLHLATVWEVFGGSG